MAPSGATSLNNRTLQGTSFSLTSTPGTLILLFCNRLHSLVINKVWLNLTMPEAVAKLRARTRSESANTRIDLYGKRKGAMAKQTIVFAQGIEMPPDILAQVQPRFL